MNKTILSLLVFVLSCVAMIFLYMKRIPVYVTFAALNSIAIMAAMAFKRIRLLDLIVILISALAAYLVSDWFCDRWVMFPL
ncbi:hypothetical protein [Paenibacillus arenilitoris]|uniref:Uncharacterized protein n=1 Tax=Paenibacillus arenilitoris TaxID=2772299 RepID=A0A927H4G3_9BACL|nr:hypothetical protein [Paenibacillus arenilitoris]MBD2867453.1 hypothetical protein [Paenibacillus arenilitoris]